MPSFRLALGLLLGAEPLRSDLSRRVDDRDYRRRVDVVQRFLQGPRRAVCDLPALDARAVDWEEFQDLGHEGGVVLRGLMGDWLDDTEWGREPFLRRFGEYDVLVGDARYDIMRDGSMMTVKEYLQAANSTDLNLLAKAYQGDLITDAFWGAGDNCTGSIIAGWRCQENSAKPAPSYPVLLVDFDKRPTLQLGGAIASGTQIHGHPETWLALLGGAKAWWIAPERPSEEILQEQQANTKHPCQWLEEPPPKGFAFCVQQPGEVIYFGTQRLHATCNLASYVLGLGAQGRLPSDWSPLEKALHRGQAQHAQAILRRRKRAPKQKLLQQWLGDASKRGHSSVVVMLLDARADLGAPAGEQTDRKEALLHAAESGQHRVVAELLARRANIEARDSQGNNPLHLAAFSGDEKAVELLLEHGASARSLNERKLAAFGSAADGGHKQIMERLLQIHHPDARNGYAAALYHGVCRGHVPIVEALLETRASVDRLDERNMSLLQYATWYGHGAVVELLTSAASGEGKLESLSAGAAGRPEKQAADTAGRNEL